jgi:hypothetical protein
MEVTMQMKNALLSVAALIFLGTAPGMAAGPVLGRITYISPDGHRLILDGQKEYTLASSVDTRAIGVAEFVRLTLGANNEVTQVAPGPADQAAYWAPRPGQS